MQRTRVVHVRREPYDIYIGRAGQIQATDSLFANPFRIGRDGSRQAVIEKYRQYAKSNTAILVALEGLRGKTLGCWCKPEACHGDVLVELLEGATAPAAQLSLL